MMLSEAYTNNIEGNEATLYDSSANITDEQEEKLADMGDQIREYIQQITQAKENVPPPNTNANTSSTGNTAVDEMNKRMAKLENMISNMCNNNNNNNCGGGRRNNGTNNNNRNNGSGRGNNNNNNSNGNGNGKDADYVPYRDRPYHKQRSMGVYCHSCGFHPVGTDHTSANCGYKKPNYDDNATWTNRGGSTIWPTKVLEDQNTHEWYAGKSAPTN